ncbi:MAG: glycosyltransferase family 39 protein [Blautia sp.]|nr:glycosyltransferase family 39 protein [Blautia sp.]
MVLRKTGSTQARGRLGFEHPSETYLYILFILAVFGLTFAWSLTNQPPAGPDENMRFMIPNYIYNHGRLPNGYDPEVRNELWGISYAFYPMLSYIISALFMKIVSLFSTSNMALICAARFTGVVFTTATAALIPHMTKRLFKDGRRWMMNALVMFLPELLFVGTYVNNDAMAIFTTAVILYAWTRYLDEGWTRKNCIILAVGMGFCLLSYYNAYGWVLMSFFLFLASHLLDDADEELKERAMRMLKSGLVVAGIVLVIALWTFVRNGILYDGDILGLKVTKISGEMYAIDELKPSLHWTPEKEGMSYKDLLLYQAGGWPHNWTIMTIYSFICAFGHYTIFMEEWMYKIYVGFIFFGFVFTVIPFRRNFLWKNRKVEKSVYLREQSSDVSSRKVITAYRGINGKGLYNTFMFIGMLIPLVLLFIYAYYNDLQAQGRYMVSSTIAVMYFVTMGYGWFMEKVIRSERIRNVIYGGIALIWVFNTVLSYFRLILPTAGWT